MRPYGIWTSAEPSQQTNHRIPICKGTLLGTPNREPQEYSKNIMEYKDPGRYIPIIYLLYSWGSRFGVPSRVPLIWRNLRKDHRCGINLVQLYGDMSGSRGPATCVPHSATFYYRARKGFRV